LFNRSRTFQLSAGNYAALSAIDHLTVRQEWLSSVCMMLPLNAAISAAFHNAGGANYGRGTHHHYAFHVSDADFDSIFERILKAGLSYGSAPSLRRRQAQ
jgi:hypothetical protein